MEFISDEELLKRFINGDHIAFENLVKRFLKPIFSFVYRYTGNVGDAEDVTQELFVKVWKNAQSFDIEKKFKTWLFSIAKNTSIDFLRKRSGYADSMDNNTLDRIPAQVHEEISINYILDKLPLQDRAIFFLYYNNHFTLNEIAESLDEPVNTIKSRHRRALERLRKIMHPN